MLRMAKVQKGDVVYDLGAGDGRIVLLAAHDFDATAVGVEIDEELCAKAKDRIKVLKLQKRARMLCADLLTIDLSDATVVTMYLSTMANTKVRPLLERFLRKGAKVVSYAFEIPGWRAVKTETWRAEDPLSRLAPERARHVLYLYVR
ncbi:MAG: SAM-dependent methyltransferase [Gammaproteobacteria bacterium]